MRPSGAQADQGSAAQSKWGAGHNIGLLVLIAAIALVSWFSGVVLAWFGLPSTSITALWIILMALIVVSIALIGHGITGRFEGFLIDARNKMSLSRLQLVLWTIVVLPAFLAAAVFNFGTDAQDPLNITVPPEVWGLLGISTGSLVGSAIIKSNREDDTVLEDDTASGSAAATNQGKTQGQGQEGQAVQEVQDSKIPLAVRQNLQDTNKTPEEASASDLFKGELEGSKDHLDVGKVQMFFFTLIVVFAYARAIAESFGDAGEIIDRLPELSAGMVALLAISHAGYLANKSVPLNATTPSAGGGQSS
jgi:hypothetical protein